MSDLTATDVMAMTNDGFGGNNSFMWIFALLLLYGGGFGGIGNRGDYGQFATAASQQDILFGQKFSDLDNKADKLGNGIADATFSLNNSIKDCCCTNKEAIAQVRYDMAVQNCELKTAIHAEGEATRGLMQQNKIEELQQQINALQMQNAMSGVVKYPMASTWSMGSNPFCPTTTGCNGF